MPVQFTLPWDWKAKRKGDIKVTCACPTIFIKCFDHLLFVPLIFKLQRQPTKLQMAFVQTLSHNTCKNDA